MSTSAPSVFIITGLSNNIGLGEEYTLKLQLNGVDVIDSTGALKSEYTSLKWFSSNINVATMEESTGKVTTVAKGEAEIHVFLTEADATEKK